MSAKEIKTCEGLKLYCTFPKKIWKHEPFKNKKISPLNFNRKKEKAAYSTMYVDHKPAKAAAHIELSACAVPKGTTPLSRSMLLLYLSRLLPAPRAAQPLVLSLLGVPSNTTWALLPTPPPPHLLPNSHPPYYSDPCMASSYLWCIISCTQYALWPTYCVR